MTDQTIYAFTKQAARKLFFYFVTLRLTQFFYMIVMTFIKVHMSEVIGFILYFSKIIYF